MGEKKSTNSDPNFWFTFRAKFDPDLRYPRCHTNLGKKLGGWQEGSWPPGAATVNQKQTILLVTVRNHLNLNVLKINTSAFADSGSVDWASWPAIP